MTGPGIPNGPAMPHAFGCRSCVQHDRARIAAEHVAGRLLVLLAQAELREARQRDEIGDLEQRLTRHTPTWDTSERTTT